MYFLGDIACLMIYNAIIMPKIVIALLLLGTATATTTLTTSNCPHNFNPASYNTSLTHTNQALASSLYGSAISAELRAKVQKELTGGDVYTLEQ